MDKQRIAARVDRQNARLQKQLHLAMLSGNMFKARDIAATITKLERKKNEVCGL